MTIGTRFLVPLNSQFNHVVGIGGIGWGVAFELIGDQTLGRNESRAGFLMPTRDYCKLHIVGHYIASVLGSLDSHSHLEVSVIGVVGTDDPGVKLVREMRDAGIDTKWIREDADLATLFSVCFMYPDGAGGNITASNSAASSLRVEDILQAAELMKATSDECVAICLPEVPLEIRNEFLKQATQCENFRVASFTASEIAAARALHLFSMVDLLALNQEEASTLVGYPYAFENSETFLSDCGAILKSIQPTMRAVISAGAEGAYAFENNKWVHCGAFQTKAVSTAGAGDALLAGVVSGLAIGLPFMPTESIEQPKELNQVRSALELGVLLASFSVTSAHTIHPEANLMNLAKFALSQETPVGS
jgi:sugar/nucleoside kinase (ribokinase family)